MAFSFGAPAGQQQQQSGGLAPAFSFGQPSTAASTSAAQSAAPAFSFGAPAAKPALSLFGQPQTSNATTSTQPFSFGAPSTTTATSSAPFSFSTPAQQQPAAGGFSFGAPQQPQQQQQQAQPAASSNPLAKFGASIAAPAPTAPQTGMFGSLGQTQAAAASGSSGPLSKSTRFEDLPEALRNDLLEFEGFIQARVAVYDDLRAKTMGEDIAKAHHLIADLDTTTLTQIYRTIGAVRTRVEASHKDRVKISRIVDAHRPSSAPSNQLGATSAASSAEGAKSVATFPYEYFTARVDEMATQLASYKTAADQIRSQLAHHDPDQVKAILPTLRHQNQLTLALAARIATLHEEMQELEAHYLALWRSRTSSVRNPFDEARRAKAATGQDVMQLDTLAIR